MKKVKQSDAIAKQLKMKKKLAKKKSGHKTQALEEDSKKRDVGEPKTKDVNPHETRTLKDMEQFWKAKEELAQEELSEYAGWRLRHFNRPAAGRKGTGDYSCPDYLAQWRSEDGGEEWNHFFEIKVVSQNNGDVDPASLYGQVSVQEIFEYRVRCHELTIGLEVFDEAGLDEKGKAAQGRFTEHWKNSCCRLGVGLWTFYKKAGSDDYIIEKLVRCERNPSWPVREKELMGQALRAHVPPDMFPVDLADFQNFWKKDNPQKAWRGLWAELDYVMETYSLNRRKDGCENVLEVLEKGRELVGKVEGQARERDKAVAEHQRYQNAAYITALRDALDVARNYHNSQCEVSDCVVKKEYENFDFSGTRGRPPKKKDAEFTRSYLREKGL